MYNWYIFLKGKRQRVAVTLRNTAGSKYTEQWLGVVVGPQVHRVGINIIES